LETFPEEGIVGVLTESGADVGILPESGAGLVLTEAGLKVAVCFFLEGGTAVLADVGSEVDFLGCRLFGLEGGGAGGGGLTPESLGFHLLVRGLEGGFGFLALTLALATTLLARVVVVVVVVVVVAVMVVVVAASRWAASSASGFTTTSDVTGVTKLYSRERLVALSVSSL